MKNKKLGDRRITKLRVRTKEVDALCSTLQEAKQFLQEILSNPSRKEDRISLYAIDNEGFISATHLSVAPDGSLIHAYGKRAGKPIAFEEEELLEA